MAVHDQFAGQVELYALGALSRSEREAFEDHLAGCAVCAAEVRAYAPITAALASTSTPAEPSPAARAALLDRVGRRDPLPAPAAKPARVEAVATPAGSTNTRAAFNGAWLAAAASLAIAVALGGYAAQLRGRVGALESRLEEVTLRANLREREMADARRAADRTSTTIAVLTAPDLARVDLAGQAVAPQASARAFWSRSRGLVLTASNLPAPPPGRTYQLWVLTAQPAPISAGLLRPDASGRATVMFETPVDLPKPVAMAVTLEPEGGVPSPTGEKYLVGLAP